MGKDYTPRYRIDVFYDGQHRRFGQGTWETRARYGARGHGRPTVANLERYIRAYNESVEPGGVNHCADRPNPPIARAIIVRQSDSAVMAIA